MATAEDGGGPTVADTAKEYAARRLENAAERLSPSDLAEEYGCTNPHMRDCLRELIEEGVAERPEFGEYIHADAAEENDVEADESAEDVGGSSGGDAGADAAEDSPVSVGDDGVDAGDAAAAGAAGAAALPTFIMDEEGGVNWTAVLTVLVVLLVAYLLMTDSSEGGESSEPASDSSEEPEGQEDGGLI